MVGEERMVIHGLIRVRRLALVAKILSLEALAFCSISLHFAQFSAFVSVPKSEPKPFQAVHNLLDVCAL